MSETPYRPWMHSLLDRMKELYGNADAKTIAEALPDGGFFKIKGSVDTESALPSTGNTVGDIYIVSADGSEHIWVTSEDYPNGYWEKLGTEGSSVTPASIVTATGHMTSQQAATTRENLGAVPANTPRVVNPVIIEEGETDGISISAWYDEDDILHCQMLGTAGDDIVHVHGIGQPEQDTDAANKWYVDGYVNFVTSVTPTITPYHNYIYKCGTLTSLTISNPPATGAYSIVFTSGSTPTTTTFPATILGLESFAAEANTLYEINVLDNRAVVGSWAVSA